jgi:kinesin family protein 11
LALSFFLLHIYLLTPFLFNSLSLSSFRIVVLDRNIHEIRVTNPSAQNSSDNERVFTLDNVFDESIPQAQIYEETVSPIVHNILEGYNGTVFAYGLV